VPQCNWVLIVPALTSLGKGRQTYGSPPMLKALNYKTRMIVKNISIIFLALFLVSGCYEKDENSYRFEWATLNSRLVESEILKISKKQNPYPTEINIDMNELRKNSRNISNQISSLTRTAKSKCLIDKSQASERRELSIRRPGSYDKECVSRISSDPLISDLRIKKENLDQISILRSTHDKRVKEASKVHLDILVREYSKDKFDLVLNNDRNSILYNKSGLSIDITEALLNAIRASEPNIKIEKI